MLPVGDSVVSGLAVTHDSDGQQPGNVRPVLATGWQLGSSGFSLAVISMQL
jgi:hypothetical protein